MATWSTGSGMPSAPDPKSPGRRLSHRKLLLSKWTAVRPSNRERHFLVTAVIDPATPGMPPEEVDLEAVLTKRVMRIPWRTLADCSQWLQGWR